MKVVKRRGHTEPFDERKLYASVYAACRATHVAEQQAEKIAQRVTDAMHEWMQGQGAVSSDDLLEHTAGVLKNLHEGAALLYRTHMDIA